VIEGVGVSERHATDLVTALNFDIRAFDTLGEEFILFASVIGVVLILREIRGERMHPHQQEADEHSFAGASEALRATALALIPALIALGTYVVVHGHLTPGGGFQGGVILAAGPLVVFLAGRYLRMKVIAPHALAELADALGAAGYALIGLGGLIFAGLFFKNFIPLGTAGHLLSAGQMPLASVAVGVEVSGAFLVGWTEFLDQALLIRADRPS
jgi:multicomponent Na+:H+ antiporter subunit B